jgi:hypothetical protein
MVATSASSNVTRLIGKITHEFLQRCGVFRADRPQQPFGAVAHLARLNHVARVRMNGHVPIPGGFGQHQHRHTGQLHFEPFGHQGIVNHMQGVDIQ